MSSARVRFTAAERRACERFIGRIEAAHPDDIISLCSDDVRALATVARLVLMLTDAPARARIAAKAARRKVKA